MSGEIGEELQNLIERYEQAPETRLFAPLADAYRKSGDIDRAIEICDRGIERFPDYASAHVILGKCYYDKGVTGQAKDEFLRVLELDPENMVALKFVGEISLAEDRRDEAVTYFKRLLSINPLNEEVSRILKEMEAEFKVREIDLGAGKDVTNVERPQELATMTLAGIYASQGYYNKALKIYQDILLQEPGNKEAREMVEKLEDLQHPVDEHPADSVEDDVLTISLDDVDEEMKRSTAGKGGGDDRAVAEAPGPAERSASEAVQEDMSGPSVEEKQELASVVEELEREEGWSGETATEGGGVREPAEKKNEPGDGDTEEGDGGGDSKEAFKSWLRKLHDKQEED